MILIKASPHGPGSMTKYTSNEEGAMATGEVLFIGGFIIAFAVFAIVLGWADQQTRGLSR